MYGLRPRLYARLALGVQVRVFYVGAEGLSPCSVQAVGHLFFGGEALRRHTYVDEVVFDHLYAVGLTHSVKVFRAALIDFA